MSTDGVFRYAKKCRSLKVLLRSYCYFINAIVGSGTVLTNLNEDVFVHTILIGFVLVSIVDSRVNDHNYTY